MNRRSATSRMAVGPPTYVAVSESDVMRRILRTHVGGERIRVHPLGVSASRAGLRITWDRYFVHTQVPMSASPILSSNPFHDLAAHFEGRLIRPDSTEYDAARSVWNAMIDR